MTSREAIAELSAMLRQFISGDDRSLHAAGRIEGALVEAFPNDERFEDLLDALASYQPGGGPLLYGEEAIVVKCRAALMRIESTMA
jgi:hypothetical protein